MRKLVKGVSVVACVLSGIAACSGGTKDASDAGTSDASQADSGKKVFEAGADSSDGAVTCTASATYDSTITAESASFTPTPADAGADAGPEDFYQLTGSLNTDIDFLDLELYDGYGAFTNGIATGTYTLTGDDLNYGSCGLCALVFTDGQSLDTSTDVYMATGGSITITSLTPSLTGTLTNVTFTHVTVDANNGYESTPVGDGCNSKIATLDFTATVQ